MEMMAMGVEVDESQKPAISSSSAPPRSGQSLDGSMVGFDEHLINIMDAIASHKSSLQVLALAGMGGIGKTTLTRAVYDKPYVKENFKIRLWTTISQSYNVQDIFLGFLHDLADQINKENMPSINDTSSKNEKELGVILHKALFGRKYLVVLDDVWSVEVWDRMRRFFPDNGNGSRVVITTRLLDMASQMASRDPYKLELLDEHDSWALLKEKVFVRHDCPSMLEDIGRQIAASCRGLPLAIVVIGGQLAKSDMTVESWKHIRGAMNSIINSEDDERCLKILSLSYDNLPIHLKPCFLYMGAFPEDSEVSISKLVKSWVAEGFLKPTIDKCLEDTAMEYLTDLIKRNLIIVSKWGSSGKIKSCRIHDLLRDLCLRKAGEQKFLCIRRFYSPCITDHGMKTEPHMSMQLKVKEHRYHPQILKPLRSTSVAVTHLKCASMSDFNSRCLTLTGGWFRSISASSVSFASLKMFWNLQTLIMNTVQGKMPIILPPQIWEISLLRHVEIEHVILPNPPNAEAGHHYALENLQTLLVVHKLKLTEDMVKRIPNVRKLKMHSGCLVDVVQLCKLESLSFCTTERIYLGRITFPRSLKKLTLEGGRIPWKEMTIVGSLPNLEVLRLLNDAFCGSDWNPIEGDFFRLRSLLLRNIFLEHWEAESIHFPVLESLILDEVRELEEIPLGVGDISTLRFLSLRTESSRLADSFKQHQEHQESMGNSDVQFHVTLLRRPWWITGLIDIHNLWPFFPRGKICDMRGLRIPGASRELEISEAKDEAVILEEDLDLFKDFLADCIMKRKEDKLVRQIEEVVDEAEKIIDRFGTMYEKLNDISDSYYEDNRNSISKEFKAISLRVQDIYGDVKFNDAFNHWFLAQISSVPAEEITLQRASKDAQKSERYRGRWLQNPRHMRGQNKARIRNSPRCR